MDNPPAVSSYSQTYAVLDNPAGGATSSTPSSTPGRIQALPLNYKTPYIQQYSLDIQQQITPTLMLDVGYFGDHGTHLLGILEINQPGPARGSARCRHRTHSAADHKIHASIRHGRHDGYYGDTGVFELDMRSMC